MAEPEDRAVPDRPDRPNPSDALDFEPVTRKKTSGVFQGLNFKLFFMLVVLTVAGGGGAWYFYGDRMAAMNGGGIPLIRAAEGPVRVRPENPGGMEVPDRDKLVYDRMQGLKSQQPERLLPPPEAPLPLPGPLPGTTPTVTEPEKPAAPPPVKEEPAVPTKAEVEAISKPAPAPAPPEAVVKAEPEKAEPEKAKEVSSEPTKPVAETPAASKPETLMAATPKPDATAGVYRVQLAAVRSPDRARQEWERLKKQNQTQLGSLELSLTRADLGAKGIYYRLRAGPLKSELDARELCVALAKRKVGCLIVRPEKLQ